MSEAEAFTPIKWAQHRTFHESDIIGYLNEMFSDCPTTGAFPVIVVCASCEGSLQNTVYQWLSSPIMRKSVADYYVRQGWNYSEIEETPSPDVDTATCWKITLYKEPVLRSR